MKEKKKISRRDMLKLLGLGAAGTLVALSSGAPATSVPPTSIPDPSLEGKISPMLAPVVVDFPLKGVWTTPHTPGTKIPSHGTDLLGERYAFDFVGIDPESRSMRFYRAAFLRYLVFGVRLQDCFGWGQPIFSATAGVVVQAEDGWPERNPVHVIRDVSLSIRNARNFNLRKVTDFRSLSGNFIIIEADNGYAVYAHAQTGSIIVSPGDKVSPGQQLANVGHSGNSTAPHLHFQMMDHPDPWKAQGIPCCFLEYRVFQDGAWHLVQNGIPKTTDRICDNNLN